MGPQWGVCRIINGRENRGTQLQMLFYILSSFWVGAVHAATPGHGKTIAAAYIVGARGKPIDALILGIFVTLSHTSGIVLVGVLASLGSTWLQPQRIESHLALGTGLLVVCLGLWMLWQQRELLALALGGSRAIGAGHDHSHHHDHSHPHDHPYPHDHSHLQNLSHPHDHSHANDHTHGGSPHHDHPSEEGAGWHSHGWGAYHSHRLDLVSDSRPRLAVLVTLGIVGGLLPDPTALALLLAALASGKVLLGLVTVLVFSLGFATTLVVVGVIAAVVGQKVLEWLNGVWAVRLQIGTTLFIFGTGAFITINAAKQLAALPH
jgi:nickel/cobalt transporter (NicO) family protein